MGLLIMALADVLDTFPKSYEQRNDLVSMFKELAGSLLKYRDNDTKLWYQVVDKKNVNGNYIETSSSLMFIYAFAKGYNNGYSDKVYLTNAKESFASLIKNFIIKDMQKHYVLTNICSVGGLGGNPYRDGSFEYYISEPKRENDFKGYGALILAADEIVKSTLN